MKTSTPRLIAEYISAGAMVALGVWLLLKHHPMAGGWIVAVGLAGYCCADGKVR